MKRYGTVLLLMSLASASPVFAEEPSSNECKDFWNVEAQWTAMKAACERGAKEGDALSQVATAIHLLGSKSTADKGRAHTLLLSAAASGYDDAYYWLGTSQSEPKKALDYFEQARGTGGFGLLALVQAAEMSFKGEGVPKDFPRARRVFGKAIRQSAENSNLGIPAPPGTWWSNAKWFRGASAIHLFAARYGFKIESINGRYVVVEVEPQPALSDKELMNRL